jgi:hypothetical protein
MYLNVYYINKGLYLIQDKEYPKLKPNFVYDIKLQVTGLQHLLNRNKFIYFLFFKLCLSKATLKINTLNGIQFFSFLEYFILVCLPSSLIIKLNCIQSKIIWYNLKSLPFLNELEVLFEFNSCYYDTLRLNLMQLEFKFKYISIFSKENCIRFLKIPMYIN